MSSGGARRDRDAASGSRRLNQRGMRRMRGPARVADYRRGAQLRLRRFRQGSVFAVALTALLLLIWGNDDQALGQDAPAPGGQPGATSEVLPNVPGASLEQATTTVREMAFSFYGMLPRLAIAALMIAVAILLAKVIRRILHRYLGSWERTHAVSALAQIGVFLVALAAALSVLAGDARALLGSVGLVGLALSWALQTPIESFTGWLMNSFRSYYRVGDRIQVGEVFGDVYKIDVLTTTVWEAGGQGKAVAGAQATGALITFPNWEVLRSNITNFSRDFPYVWDEVTVNIASESDLAYTAGVFQQVAHDLFGESMATSIRQYRELLQRAELVFDIDDEPKAYIASTDAWAECTVRYLVPARARRRWASELTIALAAESVKPEHHGKIISGYPRQELRVLQGWIDEVRR